MRKNIMKNVILIILISFVLSGCDPYPNPEYEIDKKAQEEFFFKCLTLTNVSSIRQTHYSDVSKTVKACGTQAYYHAKKCVEHCDNK